jgi:hypothetical protein
MAVHVSTRAYDFFRHLNGIIALDLELGSELDRRAEPVNRELSEQRKERLDWYKKKQLLRASMTSRDGERTTRKLNRAHGLR